MKRILVATLLAIVGCTKPVPPPPAPTPAPVVVYVVVTPTQRPPAPPDYRATVVAAVPETPTALQGYTVPQPRSAAAPTPQEQLYATIEDFLVRPVDSAGALWFDGEVKNLSSRPVRYKVRVKAYSINGALLDSKEIYAGRGPIPSNGRGHFNSYVESSTEQPVYRVDPEPIPAD